MAKATTIRFADEVYARLDQAAARTGMPVNSIVIAACLEWLQRYTQPEMNVMAPNLAMLAPAPRWSTIRRAMVQAVTLHSPMSKYPFERFTGKAQALLTAAQVEAKKAGHNYIGTEHMLLGAYADDSSQSAVVLMSLGLGEELVRSTIDKVLHSKTGPRNPMMVPTSRVKKVIEIAFDLCAGAGNAAVGTGHILLALATEGKGIAAHVMKDLGADRDAIAAALAEADPET